MNLIKGLILISRFDYLEKNAGHNAIKKFLKRIKVELEDYARQPVIGSNSYPQDSIAKIDNILLEDYFNNNLEEFRRLGEWNASNFLDRFFSMYLDEQKPIEFINQYARLRPYLVGIGEMSVSLVNDKSILIRIEYLQSIPRSICLSEQGFIVQALKLCGLSNIEIKEKSCAGNEDNYVCEYKIIFA
jgi:hypothetical protein